MQDTVTYNGRPFTLERTGEPDAPYVIKGPRGAVYSLFRNRPKPHLLFPVASLSMRVPRGWFSDEGGTLRQIA